MKMRHRYDEEICLVEMKEENEAYRNGLLEVMTNSAELLGKL